MMMARGTTPVAAGVVDSVLLTAVITRQQMATQGLGPAVDQIIHRPTMTGQEIGATPLLIGGTIGTGRRLPPLACPCPNSRERSAMRALMVACTTSKVLVVSCVERAVVRGLLWPRSAWMTRHDTPRSQR